MYKSEEKDKKLPNSSLFIDVPHSLDLFDLFPACYQKSAEEFRSNATEGVETFCSQKVL